MLNYYMIIPSDINMHQLILWTEIASCEYLDTFQY